METIIVALEDIVANPLRSFLTIVGIVIGIAALIIVVGIGEGNRDVIQKKIKQMGANLLTLNLQGVTVENGQLMMGMPKFIDEKGIDELKARVSDIEAISPLLISSVTSRFKSSSFQMVINGTYTDYLRVRNIKIVRGRYFSPFEEKEKMMVCVITESVIKKIKANIDTILMKEIYLDGRRYKIIGIVKDLPPIDELKFSEQAYIPYSVLKKEYPYQFLGAVYLTINDTKNMDEAIKKVKAFLMEQYGNTGEQWVKSMTELLQEEKAITTQITLVVFGVACLSLFVGGIGIMNIMLVSIKERTKEIGIRKAIGAKNRDILSQILCEGVVFCFIGGLLGIVLGLISIEVVEKLINFPVKVSLSAVAAGLIFSSFVGLFFSIFPAMEAAKLSPVEALKYE